MSDLISVVVPVYNVEKYLCECIDSVLGQTYSDLELLLIDDGSTDNSGVICDKYAQKDFRVRVFHKENGGQPSALNYGLDVAQGEYVIFLDSDDYWCDHQILEKLYIEMDQNNLDIIRAECKEVDNKGLLLKQYIGSKYRKNYSRKIVDSLFFLDKLVDHTYFMVLYLIKRTIIGDLRYNEKRVFLQDAEFCLSLCLRPLRCMYVDDVFYAYRKHDNAITVKSHPQKLYDAFNFSRFCFSTIPFVPDIKMKHFFANEGIRNLLFDISVLAESSRNYIELEKAYNEYSIYELKKNALKLSLKYSLHFKQILMLLLPLSCMVNILRVKLKLLRFVRKLVK